jgi:hypothetical protein
MKTTREIIDQLNTQKAIAEWQAAAEFLANFGEGAATDEIRSKVGFGLSSTQAEHLVYLVHVLNTEREDK